MNKPRPTNRPTMVQPLWIAVEGLDGTGKSTTVEAVASLLEAEVITNPPASLRDERAEADHQPREAKRAWYLNANRVAASQALDIVRAGCAVVMDRSVASTLVFGAAEQGRVAQACDWPEDIPRPALLILLDVPEQERKRRLIGRQGQLTAEERRLIEDDAFRGRVLDGYRNLGCAWIDATGSTTDVLTKVQNAAACL